MPQFTPSQRAYIRKRSKPHEIDVSEAAGELNIVPFLDIVTNLIMFLLMSLTSVALFNQLAVSVPQSGGAAAPGQVAQVALNLSVTVTREGIMVAGSGGKLAAGCTSTGTGRVITVPARRPGAEYDWAALTECVAKLKDRFPDETTVTIAADPQIEFQHVASAMDAVRNRGSRELFTEPRLSAGVR